MVRLQAPKGTYDVLPGQQPMRQLVLREAKRIFTSAGYARISTPAFEETELFSRGVGPSSDIVRKEMYTFDDKGGRSLTLKPEGTAPVVRAYIQHGMHKLPQPVKLWYYERMYRFESPQAGRYREHYQLGVEAIGSDNPMLDAEIIFMLSELYKALGVPEIRLRLASMGCPDCRPVYQEKLKSYLNGLEAELCRDCLERRELNPLRVFDCKNKGCGTLLDKAPKLIDNLCGACSEHFETVKKYLDLFELTYRLDGTLVRGFDYYTRTTFEFECEKLGAQKGIGGGGRYDNLVEEIGGPPTAAAGFGTGMERIILALESADVKTAVAGADVFFMVLSDEARPLAFAQMLELRKLGFTADIDYAGRKAKGQMKQADRLGAGLTVIIGDDELKSGKATVRDMQKGEQTGVEIGELSEYLAGLLGQ